MKLTSLLLSGAVLALALALSACGTVRPARMELPAGLADRSDIVALPSLGSGQRGTVDVLGQALQFERSASRLALFDEFSVAERSALRYSLAAGSNHGSAAASCTVRRRTMAVGIIEWTAKPLTLSCNFTPSGARLDLVEQRPAVSTQRIARRGQLTGYGRTLMVRSVHQAEGGLFELAQPIGYVIEEGGRAVAAIEINGSAPRLFLPSSDASLRLTSLHALLALALMWDVANG